MQKLTTFHFGEIEYDEQKIIHFPDGIPGFPDDKRFLFMSEQEDEDTFFWLQSVDNGDVAFTLMNVYGILPNYDPQCDEEEMKELCDITDAPVEIYNIVVIPEDAKQMRVNLMAPVVINMEAGLGRQVVCMNDDYPIRYYIFEELEKFRREGGRTEC